MNDDRPKDYAEVEQMVQDMIDYGYNELPWYLKIVYHLQNHLILALTFTFGAGYIAGMFYGKFW